MKEEYQEEWLFKFGLVNQESREPISYKQAEDLFKYITEWAEDRGYGIGGGFRAFTEDERKPYPLEPKR